MIVYIELLIVRQKAEILQSAHAYIRYARSTYVQSKLHCTVLSVSTNANKYYITLLYQHT